MDDQFVPWVFLECADQDVNPAGTQVDLYIPRMNLALLAMNIAPINEEDACLSV